MLVAQGRPAPTTTAPGNPAVAWPSKVDVFGVLVSPTTYDEATDFVIAAAQRGDSGVVSCHAVHALISASCDPELRARVNTFDMITPDGQPVRWALNLLHGTRLIDRVYGPELTLRLCKQAAEAGVSIYLYGGSSDVLASLKSSLQRMFPDLCIAGYESPPFRRLTEDEDRAIVDRINASGAGLVFVGLGCPKQDVFAHEHRAEIHAVQVCVGAAFDFHAGAKKIAPRWMQRWGLEWLFRLIQEPRRLWPRYLVTNSIFLVKLSAELLNVPRVIRQRRDMRTLEASRTPAHAPVDER